MEKSIITRGDQKVQGGKVSFLHRLINRAGITAYKTATHLQWIGYNKLDVSRSCVLQLLSRLRYIVRTGPFYITSDVLLHNQLNFNFL